MSGRLHDIYGIAEGQEDYGVYPGCGAACNILNRPCNYGNCIDEYDDFKCNCTTSPNSGKFCQYGECKKVLKHAYKHIVAQISQKLSIS